MESICNGKTTTSVYGADGLRRQSTVDSSAETVTTKYLLDGQSVVQEFIQRFDKSTSQMVESTITYLNGPRGAEYRRVDNDNDGTTDSVRWYIYDGLGSVIGEIGEEDINHNVVKSTCRLDVYGAVRQSSGASESNHKFVGALGHTSESSTDLIYMRARYYDPMVGRFISEDPARDGENWYVYCRNNPTNAIDPSGEFFQLIDVLLGNAEGMTEELSAYAAAQGVKNYVVSQMQACMFRWAAQLGILYETVKGGMNEAGYTVEVAGYRLMYHLAGHAGEGPHISIWNDVAQQYVRISEEEVMWKLLSQL